MCTFDLIEILEKMSKLDAEYNGSNCISVVVNNNRFNIYLDHDVSIRGRSYQFLFTESVRSREFWEIVLNILKTCSACLISTNASGPIYTNDDVLSNLPEYFGRFRDTALKVNNVEQLIQAI